MRRGRERDSTAPSPQHHSDMETIVPWVTAEIQLGPTAPSTSAAQGALTSAAFTIPTRRHQQESTNSLKNHRELPFQPCKAMHGLPKSHLGMH